jgi:ubiquinol-cytochrome c reductase cytochrome c subunit
MTVRSWIVRTVVAAAAVAAFAPRPVRAGGQTAEAARPTANVEKGRQTYEKKGCHACHGREGQGSPTTGPRLGPNPLALAAFTRYVRAPRGQMPPFTEKVVSDAELAEMHAFLQTRPGPADTSGLLQAK